MGQAELQGTLDMLVLRTLGSLGATHGYGIAQHIERVSSELLRVEEGSLYPALHRMEQKGLITSEWDLTETKRKAKYYKITRAGWRHLRQAEENFDQLVKGIRSVMRYA